MSSIATTEQIAPSTDQVAFMNDLLDKIGRYDSERAELLRSDYRKAYVTRVLTKQRASKEIDWLKDIVEELKASMLPMDGVKQNFDGPVPQVPSGGYAVETDEGHLAFYEVESVEAKELDGRKITDDTYFTVNLRVSDSLRRLAWPNALTILRKIEQAGVLEASMAYGRELGECGNCGRALTNEKSRERGIGPICASQLAG